MDRQHKTLVCGKLTKQMSLANIELELGRFGSCQTRIKVQAHTDLFADLLERTDDSKHLFPKFQVGVSELDIFV